MIQNSYVSWSEVKLRYCINQALEKHSPISVAFNLAFKGRKWLQDLIIEKLEENTGDEKP